MNFDNLEDIINKTSKNWNVLFYNGVLFLSSKKYKFFPQDKMKKLINCNNIFIEDAGKYGQIQVIVESIDASTDNLLNGIWPTAPKRWVLDIVSGKYNSNVGVMNKG
jgi:hypothetical protein